MAIKIIKHFIVIVALFGFATVAIATVPTWEILPQESKLTFTGTLNGSPSTGYFKTFHGSISFDPKKINESHIQMAVDINSITTSYSEIANTLKMSDWFDAKQYPQATFLSNKIVEIDNKTYQAIGKLTIRNKTLPVTISFIKEKTVGNKIKVTGSTTIKRSDFDVGTGEWADTDSVKDEVRIDFVLTLINKNLLQH